MTAPCQRGKVAENRWVWPGEIENDLPEDERETKRILRKFLGILNKLTPQKFKDLAEQALCLPLTNMERLNGCVDMLFEKALREPLYSVAYANLCRVMSPIKVTYLIEQEEMTTTFRREVLSRCQKEFEKDRRNNDETEAMQEAIETAETPELKQKYEEALELLTGTAWKRYHGCIRFIGEIFNLKLLSEAIVHDIIVRLLRSPSDEESIECFCKLIITSGRNLDHEMGKLLMDKYFLRIEEIIAKKKISARIKFMLQDVQETRENNWVPRHPLSSLKTIDQIHQEAQQEHEQEQEWLKHGHTHLVKPKHGRGQTSWKSREDKYGSRKSAQWFGQGVSRKVLTHQPIKEVVKLELRKAEHRWVRPMEVEGELSVEEKENKEVFRKFQGILNKLTPQKFKDLAKQALNLPLSNPERLKGCIDKIFTMVEIQALEKQNFSVAYANLCRVMSPIKISWVTEEGKEATTTFRRELLTKCQKVFEKEKKDDEEREKMQKAVEDAETPELKEERQKQLELWETLARKRSLENIQFIGELFKLKMLSESIMHDCIVRLLKSSSDEASIECFCRLIITIGKELDHEKGKQLMDKYFMRIEEIITKRYISARIKFILQDVQETRENDWVPRHPLPSPKMIDQIHREAQQGREQEQELIKHITIHSHPSMAKPNRRDSGDKKRGSRGLGTSGQQDKWRKDVGRRPEQIVDVSRLQAILRKGKYQKELSILDHGGGFHLGDAPWSRKPVTATPFPEQPKSDKPGSSKGPLRTSSGGGKCTERGASDVSGHNSQQRVRRAGSSVPRSGSPIGGQLFNNRSEKESAVNLVKQLNHPHEPEPAQLQREQTQQKAVDKLDEDTITRKSHTIVDVLTNNKDFKESIQCVEEMDSPSKMDVFIRESIFHALEKSSLARTMTGDLLHQLVDSNILSQEQMSGGLSEVLELAEDLEVDIPLFWDYFAECVCMMVAEASFSLSSLAPLAVKCCVLKAPRCVAKVITHCAKLTSPEKASELFAQSGLSWTELGVSDSNVAKFLETEAIKFLQVKASQDTDEQYFLTDLVKLLRTEKNDDILSFIEKKIPEQELRSPQFVRTLAEAIIRASTTEGPQVEFNADRFRTLSVSLRKYANEDDALQVEILNAAQVTVAKLNHPPGLLHNVFHHLYDVETIKETTFIDWLKRGTEDTDRGVALQSVKGFFDWLENADPESDNESGT